MNQGGFSAIAIVIVIVGIIVTLGTAGYLFNTAQQHSRISKTEIIGPATTTDETVADFENVSNDVSGFLSGSQKVYQNAEWGFEIKRSDTINFQHEGSAGNGFSFSMIENLYGCVSSGYSSVSSQPYQYGSKGDAGADRISCKPVSLERLVKENIGESRIKEMKPIKTLSGEAAYAAHFLIDTTDIDTGRQYKSSAYYVFVELPKNRQEYVRAAQFILEHDITEKCSNNFCEIGESALYCPQDCSGKKDTMAFLENVFYNFQWRDFPADTTRPWKIFTLKNSDYNFGFEIQYPSYYDATPRVVPSPSQWDPKKTNGYSTVWIHQLISVDIFRDFSSINAYLDTHPHEDPHYVFRQTREPFLINGKEAIKESVYFVGESGEALNFQAYYFYHRGLIFEIRIPPLWPEELKLNVEAMAKTLKFTYPSE